jgi:hypothetical protein
MPPITAYLEKAKLARKQSYKNLTLFPLLGRDSVGPDYFVLEQALDHDLIRITEVDQDGNVPELKVVNRGAKAVLIIEGEELVGAKQNRIVNATFLIAAKSEITLPVSCVEQGRWHYDKDDFQSGRKMMHASLRRDHQQEVRYSLERKEGYRSNQGQIWDDIAAKADRMKVKAPTGAMAAVYETYEDHLSNFLDNFHLMECQVGAVFAINGQVLGLEGFGCSDTFALFFDKLVKSYALDAIDNLQKKGPGAVPPAKARSFLASAGKSKSQEHPTPGMGKNIRFESRVVSGAALVENGRLLHLSAFRKQSNDGPASVKFQRYSRRRTRYNR